MRARGRTSAGAATLAAAAAVAFALAACAAPEQVEVPGRPGAVKTAATKRAERRLYDGAPPVIPHEEMGADCIECHGVEGMALGDEGFAPPAPHDLTKGLSDSARCRQCHVARETDDVFRANTFVGLRQDLRSGKRLYPGAPPVMPHPAFMRENCLACHSGPAAREEIRTPHPDRPRCRQCHVEQTTTSRFVPTGGR